MTRASYYLDRAGWIVLVVLTVVLFLLIPFGLAGYELARVGILYGSGFATALANMEIVVRLIENRRLAGVLFLLTGVAGLILLLLALPHEWSHVEVGNRPSGNTKHTPFYLFARGLLFGFVVGSGSLLRRSSAPPTREASGERRRLRARGLLVVGGAVLAVFGLLFVLYVLGAYVLAPVLRYFL